MNELERIEQAKSCHHYLKGQQQRSFCKHHLQNFGETLEATEQIKKDVLRKNATFEKETGESKGSLENLHQKAMSYSEMLKIELPHIEALKNFKEPSNIAEKELHAEQTIELIDLYRKELYFAEEALAALISLDQVFATESEEGQQAKDDYHNSVAKKNMLLSELILKINQVKRFVRRTHGIQSKEYQALKNDAFDHPTPKKKE